MFLGAGLVLSGCGDDDTATTPAPAPPPPPPPAPEPEPEPEPPAPEAPATPTGFHVDTTQTSLTWHWKAVEGAIGYAVQVSTDETFDETDTINPTAETHFTVADLPPQTTLYGRVAAAAGTLEAPILSPWTTHVTGTTDMPPPPPPPPMAPATPTGLMAEGGMGSITWSWDAVEGADGYAVQVSMDEMFDDMDEMTYTMETMHTVSDLGYGATRFARVASTSGEGEAMLMSMWTTHMTGMSMAEPPPPPPPALEVSFSFPEDPDSPYYLVPVDGPDDTNKDKATASVNKQITVTSNATAEIMPMWMDDANPVRVGEGDSWPFSFVDWTALQKDVVSEAGVVFQIMRVTVGANQDMEPTGDVAYVTCGPFQCTESSDMVEMAPAITTGDSEICSAWSPNFNLEVGRVDNAGGTAFTGTLAASDATTPSANPNTGIDLGWVYTSDAGFTAEHSLAIVSAKSGAVKKASTKASLMVPDVGDGIQGSARAAATGPPAVTEILAPCDHYDGLTGNVAKPGGANCFRILANPNANYWENYSVTLTSDASISWGKISWDAFKGLDCAKSMHTPSDDVDVCELFAAEVDLLGKVTPVEQIAGTDATDTQIKGFNFDLKQATKGKRFNSLWYMQSTKSGSSKSASNANTTDLYVANTDAGGATIAIGTVAKTASTTAAPMYWYATLDEDNDPKADLGDFGLVDTNGDDVPENFAGASDVKCSRDDGGEKRTALDKKGNTDATDDEGNGSLCDADDVEFEASVTFVDGIGLGCSETLAITVTCQWDADGGEAAAVAGSGDDISVSRTTALAFGTEVTDTSTSKGYLSCKAASAR